MDEAESERILRMLVVDPFFSDWSDRASLFDGNDVDRAIATFLAPEDPRAPDARDRALRRLALFQVVAPHLDPAPASWVELLGRLSPEEARDVDELLGPFSLGELLE